MAATAACSHRISGLPRRTTAPLATRISSRRRRAARCPGQVYDYPVTAVVHQDERMRVQGDHPPAHSATASAGSRSGSTAAPASPSPRPKPGPARRTAPDRRTVGSLTGDVTLVMNPSSPGAQGLSTPLMCRHPADLPHAPTVKYVGATVPTKHRGNVREMNRNGTEENRTRKGLIESETPKGKSGETGETVLKKASVP